MSENPTQPDPMAADPEQARNFGEAVIATAPVIILLLDPEGRIRRVNPQFSAITGYEENEVRDRDWFSTFLPERDRDRTRTLFRNAISGDGARCRVTAIVTRAGEEREIEWSDSVQRDAAGRTTGLLCVGQDVTERKHAEEASRASQERLRSILDSMFAFVGLYTPEGILIEANRAPLEAAGLTREEVLGKPFWDAYWWSYSPSAQAQVREALRRAAAGETVREDFLVRLRADRFITLDTTFGPLRDERGRVTQIIGSGVDVSARRRAELESKAAQATLQAVLDSSPDWIFAKDADRRFLLVNRAFAAAHGVGPEAMLGLQDSEFWQTGSDAGASAQELTALHMDDDAALAGHVVHNLYDPVTLADGTARIFDTIKLPLPDVEGRPYGMLAFARDVTEQRRTEEALRASQLRLTEAQRLAQLGSWELDLLTNALSWSDEIFRIFEIDPERFGASYDAFLNAIHPDDRAAVNEAYRRSIATREPYQITHRLRMADGRIKHVEERGETFYAPDGTPVRSVGTVQDITRQREAELLLQLAREELEATLQAIPDLLFELDRHGRYLAVRAQRTDLLAAAPEQLVGKSVEAVLPPEGARAVLDGLQEASRVDVSFGRTFCLPLAGSEHWFELSIARKAAPHGEDDTYIVLSRDVTERERAEQTSAASRRMLAEVLGSISDGFFALSRDWVYTYANERAAEFVGKKVDELVGRRIWDVFPAMEGSSHHARYQQVFETGEPLPFLDHYPELDAWYEGAVYPFEDGISVFFRNVSDRKAAELQIAASLREKETLLREVHHRVKNNLQIISSLLHLQSNTTKDASARALLAESRARVRAIATVHDLLSQSADLSRVDFGAYLRTVASGLLASQGELGAKLSVSVEAAESFLDIQIAIPCGLIVNELLTNAVKYAFPTARHGEVRVAFGRSQDGRWSLSVADDGIGLPAAIDPHEAETLGLKLVLTLAGQLDAVMRIERDRGTRFEFMFRG